MQMQLKAAESSNRSQMNPPPRPPDSPVIFASPTAQSLPEKIHDALFDGAGPTEINTVNDFLRQLYAQGSGLSQFDLDARLAATKMAEALTMSLLDGEPRSHGNLETYHIDHIP